MTAMEARPDLGQLTRRPSCSTLRQHEQVKPKAAANWILSDISKYLNDKAVEPQGHQD